MGSQKSSKEKKTMGSVYNVILMKSYHGKTEGIGCFWAGKVFGIISECNVIAFMCYGHWVCSALDIASAVLCADHA